MKAEKINVQFEAQKIHSQFGTTEMANYKIQKLCEEYAKDQIQKDRERVKKEYYNETNSSDFNEMIKNTPLILE